MDIENQVLLTVVFPDSSLPEPTNGGFENQDEFRNFVMNRHNSGRWSSELHSRPQKDRIADYKDDTLADAFPLQFPFGFTGLAEDPVNIQTSRAKGRYRNDVLRKYLMHRNPDFHTAMFILIVDNILLKAKIFQQGKIQCNSTSNEYSKMGEQYGNMTSEDLITAIGHVRNKIGIQYSASPPSKFLRSLKASCSNLPHTNEATAEARQTYFAMLMKFGLPAIFLTVTPDDIRNFRIMVYSLVGKEGEYVSGFGDKPHPGDAEILADFKYRQAARVQYPGLCAVEYNRIVTNVIRNLFNWDVEKQQSTGTGLFGTILGYALATEEQGRKTLHGHFLVFVKDWKEVLNVLQTKLKKPTPWYQTNLSRAKNFYRNACSARLFEDFEPGQTLDVVPVFYHSNCRGQRSRKKARIKYTVEKVSDQIIMEMRHKQLWKVHGGLVAICDKATCSKHFFINEIVSNALGVHFGSAGEPFTFPDGDIKRLDRIVYEMQKDFQWINRDKRSRSLRYFASNALVNVHMPKHNIRCFKKGCVCYANLPDSVSKEIQIEYSSDFDIWSDWRGKKEKRYMFCFRPQRLEEDAFMNVHNTLLTCLLGCNTNVMAGMNGKSVFYVTSYNAKPNQKEENMAYERLANIMIKILRSQVRREITSFPKNCNSKN